MSVVSGGASPQTGNGAPGRVNFGWLTEAWQLFTANAPLWIAAVVLGVVAPAVVFGSVFVFTNVVHHATGVHAGLPSGAVLGLQLLVSIYMVYIFGGIGKMAVKQVQGEPIVFQDIFRGGSVFPNMLLLMIVGQILYTAGLFLLFIGMVFAAAMLLPAYAMVADGKPVGEAIARSAKGMIRDRGIAMGFTFILLLILSIVITMPLFWLVSALAYRDVVGFDRPVENIDAILGIETPKPWEQSGAQTADFGFAGAKRVSLSGEPLDENDTTPPAKS
jgi:hypothetical protein